MAESGSKEVDAYIAAAPKTAQPHLRQLRALIKEAAPKAEEKISYKMPSYNYRGNLVYFSAFRHHVGLYPSGYAEKYPDLKQYMSGKGTLRFPLDEPLPAALIKKFIKTRVRENEAKA